VQFAAEADTVPNGKVYAFWPLVATIDMKNRYNRRRLSIAPGDVESTIEAIERHRQEEEARANRIEQARIAESNKAKNRNLITQQLDAQKWTIQGNKTAGMNKLIDGDGNEMADETKIGRHWQDDELDAIVADYFAMLAADLSGQQYVKFRHSKALMAQIGRTHRSVEFQHQNISAVLECDQTQGASGRGNQPCVCFDPRSIPGRHRSIVPSRDLHRVTPSLEPRRIEFGCPGTGIDTARALRNHQSRSLRLLKPAPCSRPTA
jgi:hypothetical protein